MRHFKLSKYSNADYVDIDNVWSSVFDIGKKFNDGVLTKKKYLTIENKYIGALHSFIEHNHCGSFKVLRYEDNRGLDIHASNYFNISHPMLKIRGGEIVSIDTMLTLFKLCLRESIWLRLQSQYGYYITFGYDFYVNLGGPEGINFDKTGLENSGLYLRTVEEDPHE